MLDRISLRQLRALRALADHGSVAAAAKALRLTGPAVHTQLKNLEETIGAEVVDRDGRGGGLTLQGAALLRAQGEIVASLTRALSEVEALNSGACGNVTLGVVTTCKYFAPGIVALLGRDMPGISITLKIGNRSDIIQGLERGEYDLCIMGRPPRDPVVIAEPLAPHPHVVIARPDHPLAGLDRISPFGLANDTFVMREEGSGTRILAERFIGDITKERQPKTVEMGSNETIKQAVMSGLGIALISGHTVAQELKAGWLVALRVEGMPIVRTWFVITSPNVPVSLAAAQVQEWLFANTGRFLPELGAEA